MIFIGSTPHRQVLSILLSAESTHPHPLGGSSRSGPTRSSVRPTGLRSSSSSGRGRSGSWPGRAGSSARRIAGWRFGPELWLPDFAPEAAMDPDYTADAVMTAGPLFDPRGHVTGILRAAIEAGVDVRALLWHQQSPEPDHHTDNTAAVLFIDRAENGHRGQAIRDAVGRTVGSHHQKAVVVQNADGRMAFVGGVDLACGRWDTPEHLPLDPRAAGGRDIKDDGWHDTHTMIEGPAVDDVETNFRQRWNAHPDSSLGNRTKSRPDRRPSSSAPSRRRPTSSRSTGPSRRACPTSRSSTSARATTAPGEAGSTRSCGRSGSSTSRTST
jgi:hypothetical protein